MTNREEFKVLANQIKMSNQLKQDVFEQGKLARIGVSSKNGAWTFQISLPRFLSHEGYLLFTHTVEEEFKEIATVAIGFPIKDTSNQDEFALEYFGHCIDQARLSPKVKGQLRQKKLIMSGNVLKVLVSNNIERNHSDKACNGSLVKAFRQCSFKIGKVAFETDSINHDDDLASLETHIQQEDEQSARKATEKLGKMKTEKAK